MAETDSLREVIAEARRLLMGPDPREDAQRIDLSAAKIFLPKKGPYSDLEGSEILRTERPTNVYGVAVLFPDTSRSPGQPNELELDAPDPDEGVPEELDADAEQAAEDFQAALLRRPDDDPDEPSVPAIQTKIYRPRSMGISFLCQPDKSSTLQISVTGGWYEFFSLPPDRVQLPDNEPAKKTTRLYLHHKVEGLAKVRVIDFPHNTPRAIDRVIIDGIPQHLQLKLEVFVRPYGNDNFLITVSLINGAKGMNNDQNCFFQARFGCTFVGQDSSTVAAFRPYPEKSFSEKSDEDLTMDLLYRGMPRFATGHGCAADWKTASSVDVEEVIAEAMPEFWIDTITADVPGHAPEMRQLASTDWQDPIRRLLSAYAEHVANMDAQGISPDLRDTALKHKANAEQHLDRMRRGFDCLQTLPAAERAFQLANEAMRLQQIASRIPQRGFKEFRPGSTEPVFAREWESTMEASPETEPAWRAFQIAFLLTNIYAIVHPESADRKIVDLIWFPTGGGKTEAYLGLIAFACFYERLNNADAKRHVQVLMRYTMRLLTAQQFQRAASLVCAMDAIRFRGRDRLGEPITLGIWVGNALTPNSRRDAKECIATLRAGGEPLQSLFLHSQCPWCGAEVGRAHELSRAGGHTIRKVLGIDNDEDVTFKCSDPKCHFHDHPLPFHVVDDVLLTQPPTILIATVDKFAQLPKKPRLREFFGIAEDGTQKRPPPSLIIQDELHLVSEALGSMVGAYEALVHALCRRSGTTPKIVCSTATIRTYRDQIRCLFAREQVSVFPPPEFAIGKSFFARLATDEAGETVRRKAYLGVFGSGYLSYQTAEAITIASLLQASMSLPQTDDECDPFWTLLCFFSTLRELGTTVTLMHSAVRNRIRNIAFWRGLDPKVGQRLLFRVKELTSRASSHELTRIMTELGQRRSTGKAVDACLATSIVEVGIDIPRLSLLCVVGQPKKTSTYVQATGRVGRRHPSLVVTLYDHTRARDRSVYESFRSFHERMYAGVEPTSLTPFAAPVQERALAALLGAYARLTAPEAGLAANPSAVAPSVLAKVVEQLPGPFSDGTEDAHIAEFVEFLVSWVDIADPTERPRLIEGLRRRIQEWKDWQRREWHCWSFNFNPADHNPMMLDIDPMAKESSRGVRWYVPNSMRDVDSESQLWVYPGGDLPMIPGENDELYPAEPAQ